MRVPKAEDVVLTIRLPMGAYRGLSDLALDQILGETPEEVAAFLIMSTLQDRCTENARRVKP